MKPFGNLILSGSHGDKYGAGGLLYTSEGSTVFHRLDLIDGVYKWHGTLEGVPVDLQFFLSNGQVPDKLNTGVRYYLGQRGKYLSLSDSSLVFTDSIDSMSVYIEVPHNRWWGYNSITGRTFIRINGKPLIDFLETNLENPYLSAAPLTQIQGIQGKKEKKEKKEKKRELGIDWIPGTECIISDIHSVPDASATDILIGIPCSTGSDVCPRPPGPKPVPAPVPPPEPVPNRPGYTCKLVNGKYICTPNDTKKWWILYGIIIGLLVVLIILLIYLTVRVSKKPVQSQAVQVQPVKSQAVQSGQNKMFKLIDTPIIVNT